MKKYFISTLILITASLSAQTPDEIMSWFPDIDGWQKPLEKEIFSPDNLFDRINGSAPLFIENGFREMTTADYKQGDDYITVQVYRHATPENAFGMYSSERSSDLTFYEIGGEAQGNDESFFFCNGPLYVKMHSNKVSGGVGEAMRKIAGTIVARSGGEARLPEIFSR
ncbi:MAG: hypothetical protein LBE91_13230, partial [Tannerella sp.]|nr:hypothetical protein [Tannerella sp.]